MWILNAKCVMFGLAFVDALPVVQSSPAFCMVIYILAADNPADAGPHRMGERRRAKIRRLLGHRPLQSLSALVRWPSLQANPLEP